MRTRRFFEIGTSVLGLTVACVVMAPHRAAGAGAPELGSGTLQAPILLSVEIVPEPGRGTTAPAVDCDGQAAERCAATRHGVKAVAEPGTAPPASEPIRPASTR
jgi:hypothetical protein